MVEGRRRVYTWLKKNLDSFWEQSATQIIQNLHVSFGKTLLMVRDGKFIGLGKQPLHWRIRRKQGKQ